MVFTQSRETQITMVKWTNAGGQTKRANERSFVYRPQAWRRWRNVKTTYYHRQRVKKIRSVANNAANSWTTIFAISNTVKDLSSVLQIISQIQGHNRKSLGIYSWEIQKNLNLICALKASFPAFAASRVELKVTWHGTIRNVGTILQPFETTVTTML